MRASVEEAFDHGVLRLLLRETEAHEFDELVSRDLAHSRFVHEAGVGVCGVDLRGGEDARAVQDDAVAFHVSETAVFADDI